MHHTTILTILHAQSALLRCGETTTE